MSSSAEWKGQSVVVSSALIPRRLWQTASIDVFVNGECVLRTGGVPKITGSHSAQFRHSGETHEIVLNWGRASLRSFPVQLSIDGEKIIESQVRTINWPISLWPWLALVGLLAYAATR